MALRWAMVTSQASTFASAGKRGYASRAARNVSDQASSASAAESTARHTLSTVEPYSLTTCSKGGLAFTSPLMLRPARCATRWSEQPARAASDSLLQFEEEALAFDPAGVAGQPTIGAHDPVAGD